MKITTSIGGGREDAAHAKKDAEHQKLGEYAAAAVRDHMRERDALYAIEQYALAKDGEFTMVGERPLLAVADMAREALRDYHGS